jgi:flagellar biosynthesis protein FliQ
VTDTSVLEIAVAAMAVTAKLSMPILLMTLGVGFTISLLQSMTQVQEVTLTFVPKLIGVAAVLAIGGNWMLTEMVGFTNHLFSLIPTLLQSS